MTSICLDLLQTEPRERFWWRGGKQGEVDSNCLANQYKGHGQCDQIEAHGD